MTPRLFYSSFMFLALAVFLLTRWWLPRPSALARQPWWKRAALPVAAFVGGALGAKLPFALAATPDNWLDGTAWLSDGKTVVAGLIGAYLSVELAKWLLDIRVKTGDTFALPLALALAVGRWGCFFNGCCYGTETTLPWGVNFYIRDGAGWRWARCHPTQIYESIFHFSMAIILWQLMLRDLLARQRLKLYLIAYGLYRFATEYIRPEPAWWLGLTFYQWAALALAAGLAVQWWIDRRPPVQDAVAVPAPGGEGAFTAQPRGAPGVMATRKPLV
jgi:phosphatidylglycerol---prolipoprotein diacylglyceryl transferase